MRPTTPARRPRSVVARVTIETLPTGAMVARDSDGQVWAYRAPGSGRDGARWIHGAARRVAAVVAWASAGEGVAR